MAVINLNNLIPVNDTEIQLVDMDQLMKNDPKYCDLLNNQILIIRKRQAEIIKDVILVYKIKTRNYRGYEGLKKDVIISMCWKLNVESIRLFDNCRI